MKKKCVKIKFFLENFFFFFALKLEIQTSFSGESEHVRIRR